ncbi:protein translocase subunit secG [Breoghania corrubedonensis]|uniref:Protein-export membrane protein SecG n=1 Tax=Breoghania corrubedonensis TaxID=665038 RepID=A0A2T5VBP1_9HYPH|nr:preprotein translocase subunit SecG [Breoghania corrubedonensis]PTW61161.1 protein translocase subunit secG [Breoghania corrubedonensis]
MQTVIIVIHLMVVLALVAVVLLQRSEGGALGIGGGGGFMSSRGTANVLTRATAILAAIFFVTSIVLTILAQNGERPSSILDQINTQVPATAPSSAPGEDGNPSLLDSLKQASPPQQGDAPAGAAPAGSTPSGTDAPANGAAAGDTPAAPAAPSGPQVPVSQ